MHDKTHRVQCWPRQKDQLTATYARGSASLPLTFLKDADPGGAAMPILSLPKNFAFKMPSAAAC